jgi:hypothetical protein
MQVDPIKTTLKPRGTTHLKLGHDEPPSHFAFKFNLRQYSMDASSAAEWHSNMSASADAAGDAGSRGGGR